MNGDMNPEFYHAIYDGELTTVQRMLREGVASTKERDKYGRSALLIAVYYAQYHVVEWLLEYGGSSITERCRAPHDKSAWEVLMDGQFHFPIGDRGYATTLTSMLRVMVLREDPPTSFAYYTLSPEHARVLKEGARLRARLPAYLARRRAIMDDHCPLISPLRALVRGYDPEPTTTEEIWATGLGADP
jgi:ankyrin repeat protein